MLYSCMLFNRQSFDIINSATILEHILVHISLMSVADVLFEYRSTTIYAYRCHVSVLASGPSTRLAV